MGPDATSFPRAREGDNGSVERGEIIGTSPVAEVCKPVSFREADVSVDRV